MDVTFPLIAAVMSLAAYLAGRRRGVDHGRELKKIGRLVGVPRRRHETDDDYATRLVAFMQTEKS